MRPDNLLFLVAPPLIPSGIKNGITAMESEICLSGEVDDIENFRYIVYDTSPWLKVFVCLPSFAIAHN
jgi:hypothetical protein